MDNNTSRRKWPVRVLVYASLPLAAGIVLFAFAKWHEHDSQAVDAMLLMTGLCLCGAFALWWKDRCARWRNPSLAAVETRYDISGERIVAGVCLSVLGPPLYGGACHIFTHGKSYLWIPAILIPSMLLCGCGFYKKCPHGRPWIALGMFVTTPAMLVMVCFVVGCILFAIAIFILALLGLAGFDLL